MEGLGGGGQAYPGKWQGTDPQPPFLANVSILGTFGLATHP